MTHLFDRKLLLSPNLEMKCTSSGVIITTLEHDYVLECTRPDVLQTILESFLLCNRASDLDDAGTSIGGLQEALEMLLADDLLLDVDRTMEAVDSTDVCESLNREARFWVRPIYQHPFWSRLANGECTNSLLFGWGVEYFHFIDAANFYMPLGVAHTRQMNELRQRVARHYVEEINHSAFFLEGLKNSGIDRESVIASPPLPHTRALINLLAELAYEGEITYCSSFAVMQAGNSASRRDELKQMYTRLAELYPYAARMLEAFYLHAKSDLDLAHDDTIFSMLCNKRSGMSSFERKRASHTMQVVAEAFTLFFDGILDFYSKQDVFSPRRRFYMEAFE